MSAKSAYLNPDNLPVENVTLSVSNTGVLQQVKALDPFWVEKRELSLYERPPTGSSMLLGAVEAWKTKMEAYLEDVKWLLSLEYHKFWSTVLFHPQCMDSLVSFLQESNPPYLPQHESREVQRLYEEIRRLVLVVFSRLVTNKESKSQWMSKEFMADTLYEKFIFTIPIIWDICATYGVDNPKHVSRLLTSVFAIQPQYEADAVAAVAFVLEAFKYIILQVNKDYDSVEPPNLPETFKGFTEIRRPPSTKAQDKLTFDVLKDIVIHLLDTAMTLRIFVEVHPQAVRIFRKTNFVISIVQLYEYGIPQLYEKLTETGDETSIAYPEVEGYIDMAREELIDVFREILAVYKNAIFSGEGSIQVHVEDYLAVLLEGLSEKLLIKDYHACYPVNEDLDMLRQAFPDIDTVKTDFILQAIYSNLDDPDAQPITNGHDTHYATDNQPTTSYNQATTGPNQATTGHDQATTSDNHATPVDIPDHVKEESLISEVKDILPHLGDGFILKCLQHYGFNSERVINSILEDNLAEALRGLDQSLPIVPPDILDQNYLETGIQRLNVFDGDRFDIMNRDDVDVANMHAGKRRDKHRDLQDLLNDKTEVKRLGDIYSKYSMVCDEVAMYSDEYDDTYDSDGVTPAADAADERRPFVTPRVLAKHDEESSSEEEAPDPRAAASGAASHTASSTNNRMDFCRNPEEMRARREANLQARRGKGHKPAPQPRAGDVVGKPKGQGQEKDVLVSRERKEKHKSSRANHNRRQGAQWKRTQGMMPS